MSGHYIERWECGHVASQCRCPGPKEERTRPGKCPECATPPDQPAMPERVWLSERGRWYDHADSRGEDVTYVPESRLLAAEARVREVEWKRLEEQRQYNADWTALRAENTTLRAERDALVPLARFAMRVHDTGDNTADAAVADGVLVWVRDSECDESPAFTQARSILAREAGE